MTKKSFNTMMSFFKNSKGILITDERILSYWEVLKEYPDKYVRRVTLNCEKKHDFFPTISQIVREFESCEDEEYRDNSRVKKIEAPRHVRKDLQWIRQTLVLLSCENNQNQHHFKLYTEEELEQIVDRERGDKRLLKMEVDEFEIDTTTGEVNKKKEGEIICQGQK